MTKLSRQTTKALESKLANAKTSKEDVKEIETILNARTKKREEISATLEKNQPKKETVLKIVKKDEPKFKPKKSVKDWNKLSEESLKEPKKSAPKKSKEPKVSAPKKVGVIQTIFNSIDGTPKTLEQLTAILVKSFPEKTMDSMRNTIKTQIGSSKRPVRMEREKNVTFKIEGLKEEKTWSI